MITTFDSEWHSVQAKIAIGKMILNLLKRQAQMLQVPTIPKGFVLKYEKDVNQILHICIWFVMSQCLNIFAKKL